MVLKCTRGERGYKIDDFSAYTLFEWLLIEQAKFTYCPLRKVLEKQTEKQVVALKSLNLSNKIDDLKRIEGIFPKK